VSAILQFPRLTGSMTNCLIAHMGPPGPFRTNSCAHPGGNGTDPTCPRFQRDGFRRVQWQAAGHCEQCGADLAAGLVLGRGRQHAEYEEAGLGVAERGWPCEIGRS
jgi:hypothetical protein